jgi:hypothetical protein
MDHLPTPIGERGPVRFLNMAVGQAGMEETYPRPGALPQATLSIAVGDRGLLAKGHIHPSQGHRRWKSLCT